jgi:hypothetical protein
MPTKAMIGKRLFISADGNLIKGKKKEMYR